MPSACHGVLPLFVVLCCAGLACSHMDHITADATALFLAAESGNHEEVRKHIMGGQSVNVHDPQSGRTPLHLAAAAWHFQTSWLMLATPWNRSDDFAIFHSRVRAHSGVLRRPTRAGWRCS